MKPATARLLISCPDSKGIVAAVTGFLAQCEANLLESDQHTDPNARFFCMRLEYETGEMNVPHQEFLDRWSELAKRFKMDWRIAHSTDRKRMAIMVSKQDHCLHDLILRHRCGEIDAEIPFVISNHDTLEDSVRGYGIDYHSLPITPENKSEQENRLIKLIEDHHIDLIVLARYMQILTPEFVQRYQGRIINIHHSFLPAFAGARPYHQAYERGVKVVGATAHYVTADLDAGPIIAQDAISINHRDNVDDLIRKGRDLERTVLATAVRLHIQDKILVHSNKTVVFE